MGNLIWLKNVKMSMKVFFKEIVTVFNHLMNFVIKKLKYRLKVSRMHFRNHNFLQEF